MEAALFFEFLHPQSSEIPNPLRGQPKPEGELYAECMDQVELADKLGFHSAWSVDHHLMPGHSHMPSPEMFFATLARRTVQIRFGMGVIVLPLAHPIMTAERMATLDHLTGGRLEFGTGRGGHRADYDAMEVPYGESRERWEESLDLILKAWREDHFTYNGNFYKVEEPIKVVPKPVQQPHPPIWVATVGPDSPALIGKKGLNMLTFSFFQPLDAFAEGIAKFRKAAAEAGHDPKTLKIAASIPIHVAETAEQARKDSEELLLWYIKSSIEIARRGSHKERPANLKYLDKLFSLGLEKLSFDELLDNNRIIVGTPEQCAEQLKPFKELGVDLILGMFEFGNGDNTKLLKAIDLFGHKVLPTLKESRTTEQSVA